MFITTGEVIYYIPNMETLNIKNLCNLSAHICGIFESSTWLTEKAYINLFTKLSEIESSTLNRWNF